MAEDKKPKKIIIEGVTTEGKKFRPSDWAERMSGSLSTFKNHSWEGGCGEICEFRNSTDGFQLKFRLLEKSKVKR